MLHCRFQRCIRGSTRLSRSWKKRRPVNLSRREFLQYCQGAPLAFLPAGAPFGYFNSFLSEQSSPFSGEMQLHPEYRIKRGIETVLRKVPAGFDEFVTEKYQDQIEAIFREWGSQLLQSPQNTAALGKAMSANFQGSALKSGQTKIVNETGT